MPHDSVLNGTTGLTIEAWIKSDATNGARVIVSKWNDDSGDWSYIFKDHNSSDKLRIELSENTRNDLADLAGTTSITTGAWTHVAATYDTNTVSLYFDGAEDASQAVGPDRFIDESATDLLIGAVFTGGGVNEQFEGLIDEVSIYNRALTAEEIQSIYNAGADGKFMPMVVVGSDPAAGEIVLTQPSDFVINFSHDVDLSTLNPVDDSDPVSDLSVNGTPADSFTFDPGDPNTVTFHFSVSPVISEGVQMMSMPAGAVSTTISPDVPDPLLKGFNTTFRYDAVEMAVFSTVPELTLSLPFNTLSSASNAIVSQAGMDGDNGGWAVLYDDPTPDSLKLAIDEDQLGDTERSHTTEQAAFVVFEKSGALDTFIETGMVSGVTNDDDTWTTVELDNIYTTPDIVATPQYDASSPPLVTRIRNVVGSIAGEILLPGSFEVKVQRADGLTGLVSADVHYIVVEEGTYTKAVDGVTMEAVKVPSTVTDRAGDWNGEVQA